MEEGDGVTGEFNEDVLLQLKPYCLELLDLLRNPKKHSPTVPAMLALLRTSPSSALNPFFDYTLFPLLLLLDAAVDSRSTLKTHAEHQFPKLPHQVSDSVAEGVLQCFEELLKKCRLTSMDQMVTVLKKLTFWALLSPSEAAEEFREGVIKCFRALLLNLVPCSDEFCSCKSSGLPALLELGDLQTSLMMSLEYDSESEPKECLLAFLQSQTAAPAVGHWLSLLLKAADTEAARGHLGSSKLRIEAFITLRVLVAKVGTADALAFFLPGVVSQFAKVLHVSRTMISGAAGSVEAIDQAIRGLAEYIMIVLNDDANLFSVDKSPSPHQSTYSFLEEIRTLPIKAQGESKNSVEASSKEAVIPKHESKEKRNNDSGHEIGSFHVDRTKDWIKNTSENVNKLLCATVSHICLHPVKRVRKGLLVAIEGLLSKCTSTLKESRLMLLECLCVFAVDDSEEVSAVAQEFLENIFSPSGKYHVASDVAEIFGRLVEKLPKVVLGSEESIALSHAQKLLVVMYYSGPQLVVEHLLQCPVTAARFLDVFALCLSQNSVFAGSLDKLMLTRQSSRGYFQSVADLKSGTHFTLDSQIIPKTAPSGISKLTGIQEQEIQILKENVQNYDFPRMPPWFVHVGSQKLYEALAGILRLVGLSLMADFRSKSQLSVITDIPLSYLRKLVSEVRIREYNKESWESWYNRTGSGRLLRQASTAACILNEMIFGISDQFIDISRSMFHKSRLEREEVEGCDAGLPNAQSYRHKPPMPDDSIWKISSEMGAKSLLIDCVGRILHEYLSPEVWGLPIENKSSFVQPDGKAQDITLHFFRDTAMLHQVIIEGIGIFNVCLGKDFSSSGFLHSSLYLLLENLICSNFQVKNASDVVLNILAATSGYPTVGHLIVSNADYVIDSICRQLRHLDFNAHVPNVLAAMLSYIGVAHKILPLLEEPLRSVSLELEILGRHQHPNLTVPFLKALAEISKALKREAHSLPIQAESYFKHVKSKISEMERRETSRSTGLLHNNDDADTLHMELEQWESILFKLNDSRRYRRTLGSIAGSCLSAATPLLASVKQAACLVALDVVEDGMVTLQKVEEAYKHEKEIKEEIEQVIHSSSFYHLQESFDAAEDGTDENRLLPAMNKIWPLLVVCVRNNNSVAVRKCFSVVMNLVHICGGDFFSRRFHSDGPQFWKLLTTSPFHKNAKSKEGKIPLQLPYRSTSISSEESVAEVSNLKVQVSILNMIADLSRNKRSASALEVVLKKVSGLVVGIACSGVVGLHDASVNALHGLACMDPDLIWLLLADVYYSTEKKNVPSPPTEDLLEISQILPPPLSPKGYLYVQYGGQSYGFDIDFSSVERVFRKLNTAVFTYQMYSSRE